MAWPLPVRLLTLLALPLALPLAAGFVLPVGLVFGDGEGYFSQCGWSHVIVDVDFLVRGTHTDGSWAVDVRAYPEDDGFCPRAEAWQGTFTSRSWDPAVGGCFDALPQERLCLDAPEPGAATTQYVLFWPRPEVYAYGSVDLIVI